MYSDEMLALATVDGALLGYAVEIKMPDTWFRAHTGVGDLVIDGDTYSGVGNLGNVESIKNKSDQNPVRVNCTLNGLDAALVGEALKSRMTGLSARLMMLVFHSDTRLLLMAESALVGFVADYTVGLSKGTGQIVVTLADEFELYEMPEHKYWTDENHRIDEPDDRICRYVAQMGDRKIYWGNSVDAVKFNTVV